MAVGWERPRRLLPTAIPSSQLLPITFRQPKLQCSMLQFKHIKAASKRKKKKKSLSKKHCPSPALYCFCYLKLKEILLTRNISGKLSKLSATATQWDFLFSLKCGFKY